MSWKEIFWAGAIGTACALAGAALAFWILSALGAISRTVLIEPQGQPLGVQAVVATTLTSGLLATLAFGLLARHTRHPVYYFRIVAAIVFILMIPLPLGIESAPPAMVAGLILLHAIVALGILFGLERGHARAQLQVGQDGQRKQ